MFPEQGEAVEVEGAIGSGILLNVISLRPFLLL